MVDGLTWNIVRWRAGSKKRILSPLYLAYVPVADAGVKAYMVIAQALLQSGDEVVGFTAVDVGAGAGSFDSGEVTITLEPGDIIQAPGGYFGFAHLTVFPATGFDAFSAWGV